MPNLDGTGPMGKGPRTRRRMQNRPLGSNICACPKCGYEKSRQQGTPCSQSNCPKCQTPMKGANCL